MTTLDPGPARTGPVRTGPSWPLVVALFLVGLNLRPAFSTVPPLLPRIELDLDLGGAAAGLLTTLPVLMLGAVAPVANRLTARFTREHLVAAALGLLAVGLLVRGAGRVPVLLALGSLVAGAGIAVIGAVLPGIVKEHFPHRTGAATGAYMVGLTLGAGLGAAVAVPLAEALGSWPAALACTAAPALVAALVWLPVTRARRERALAAVSGTAQPRAVAPLRLPWRSRTAWLVSAHLACSTAVFYGSLAWVPPAYESLGWGDRDAGLLLSVLTVAQLPAALFVPALAERVRDRRWWLALVAGLGLAGMVVLVTAPLAAPWLTMVVLGLGQGGVFALGLAMLADHARDPAATSRLSAMAFVVCYLLGGPSPLVIGALRDATGSLQLPFLLLCVVCAGQVVLAVFFTPARREAGVA